ncbi:EamA family transporter RarD [Lutimaribacter sp. EGI FJ00015]|uniref:EamA family transporter RarD n=1 Tax=Lutimaribacter degradans TaxID=2945989 RepID=A0ACC5ZSS9_9RHOB|nr:EamA family transporter RarD [Lutimaribacter sp. EGI FJ00013]MCM2561235.1 EamA family transporter RarD [Lutimaribacter sp. EGI FJ00013]MCO0611816.1 EamA family transporter RarD [Lutimaribacter sp. EGI FJ00015]MCO0635063.1 EamA family transporter RarD [Lutimaribacter sp. EGI FJ00014]
MGSEAGRGILAMVVACTVWGVAPLYYKLLAHIPPIEVLAHRTIWSVLFFALVLLVQGRLGQLRAALGDWRKIAVVMAAALLISTNWFVFITSVQIGRVTEASLGYYLFPLVAVALGRLVFGERLTVAQQLPVALAIFAVALLTWGLGVTPWIALILSGTFGLYGVVKKRLDVGPVVSVTAEVALLAPIALAVLGWFHTQAPDPAFGGDMVDAALLMFSGVLTGAPLILFSYAARRVRLGTIGLVQYLNPTLQFLVAVLIFNEPFNRWHGIAFGLIWAALAIYTVATWRQDRAARRAAVNVGTS